MALLDRFEVPGATRRDWTFDGVLTGVFLLTSLPYLAYSVTGYDSFYGLLLFVANSFMVVPLVLRRHFPLLMAWGVFGAGLIQAVLSEYPMVSLVVIPVVAYSVARWVAGRASRTVVYMGAVGSVVAPVRWIVLSAGMSDMASLALAVPLTAMVCIGLVITPYAIGRRVRETAEVNAQRAKSAADRYQMMLTDREQRARMAEAQTRATIARELHDIVAHSLSVIIVQSEGARALATKKPEVAVQALDTIAETGREALGEMRRIVSVLRDGPEAQPPADYAPAPGLADIPDLVRRTSDRATLVVTGTPPPVGQTLALTAYRVVQEALTNFLKHAGPQAQATVSLSYSATLIVAEITDDGRGSLSRDDGGGNGLRGMRERVSAMGGQLVAEPRPGRGFVVRAILPVFATGQHDAGGVSRTFSPYPGDPRGHDAPPTSASPDPKGRS